MKVIWYGVSKRCYREQPASSSYLHAILEFCHDWALRDECEELAAPGERKGNDQGAEDEHLCHQEEEDL